MYVCFTVKYKKDLFEMLDYQHTLATQEVMENKF